MVQINAHTNEILLKLVYYGPGLSGKTANLHALHAMCKEDFQGEFFSVNTQEDRTLFFDLLPIDLGSLYGKTIHLKVYTVPGQPQYDATRRVVLYGADGVVFVADSTESKMQENIDSLTNLQHNLSTNGLDIKQIPLVIQYNKRDLPTALPVGVMNRKLNFRSVPYFESVAISGAGVLETFTAITKETVSATFQKHHLNEGIQSFSTLLDGIENILTNRMGLKPQPFVEPVLEKTTIVRQENTSIEDLPQGRLMDSDELLADALNSNMETARLYGDLKKAKEDLEKQNSELQQLNDQLEKANQDNLKVRKYLERLIQSLDQAIFSFGLDGRILTWNPAAESVFGYSLGEAFGRLISELTPQVAHSRIGMAMDSLREGFQTRVAVDIPLERGAARLTTVSLSSVFGNQGKVVAFSGVVKYMV